MPIRNRNDRKRLTFAVLTAAVLFCGLSPVLPCQSILLPACAQAAESRKQTSNSADSGKSYRFQLTGGEKDRWTPKILKDPGNADNYVGRGKEYMVLCEDEKALADFGKALSLDPTNREALFNRIIMLGDLGKKEEALRDCNVLIKAYPHDSGGYERRCIVHQSMRKMKEALADTDAAIKIDPGSVKAWQYRCSLYVNQGDDANAMKCLDRLTVLAPTNPVNYSVRSNYYVKNKQYAKAAADLTQVLKYRPGEFEIFIMRGDVYKEMKAYQKAVDDYSRAIELNKFRAGHAYKGRAECYKALGNTAAFESDLKQSKGGEAMYR